MPRLSSITGPQKKQDLGGHRQSSILGSNPGHVTTERRTNWIVRNVWRIAFSGGGLYTFMRFATYYLNQLDPIARESLLESVKKAMGW